VVKLLPCVLARTTLIPTNFNVDAEFQGFCCGPFPQVRTMSSLLAKPTWTVPR
jgi:hypothetical protein